MKNSPSFMYVLAVSFVTAALLTWFPAGDAARSLSSNGPRNFGDFTPYDTSFRTAHKTNNHRFDSAIRNSRYR